MGRSSSAGRPEYSILVNSPNGGKRYGVRPWVFRSAVVLLVSVLAIAVVAAVLYGRIVAQATATMELRQEVARLEEQLVRLEGIQADIQRLEGMRQEALELTGGAPEELSQEDPGSVTSGETHPEVSGDEPSVSAEMNHEGLEMSGRSQDKGTKGRKKKSGERNLARVLTTVPCRGTVVRGFGAPLGEGTHRGVEIGVNTGTRILAAGAGTVVSADEHQVFGLLIILDHGGGVVTLYGRGSNIFVSAGDLVKAGQPIAEVGSVGLGSSPRLYFEVRNGGRSVDPGVIFPSLRGRGVGAPN